LVFETGSISAAARSCHSLKLSISAAIQQPEDNNVYCISFDETIFCI
jgi:DNA-binding transcriptional LysR family regulator